MQKKKDLVREKILNAASAEFCSKGYMNTSIRKIAMRAGVSPANMYNYFRDKDDLFNAVIGPVIFDIEKGKQYLKSPRALEEVYNLQDHLDMVTFISTYVEERRELFNLLFFKSFGSEYENYIDMLSEWYTDLTSEFLPWMSSHLNTDEICIDRFVLHNIAGIWIQFFREALMHDTAGEDFLESAREVMTFSYRGWKGLFKYKTCV